MHTREVASLNECVCRFIWGCVNLWLKRGGKMVLEVGLIYGVRMNYMITFESIEFSFSFSYILYVYKITLRFGAPVLFSPTVYIIQNKLYNRTRIRV